MSAPAEPVSIPLEAIALRLIVAVTLMAFLIGSVPCLAQPAGVEGGDTPSGTPIKAKSEKFTLECPAGWQSRQYEKLEESMTARLTMQGGLMKMLGEDPKVTDNINLWWSPQGEASWFMTGIASVHRIETKEDVDMQKVWTDFNGGKLPEGIKAQPAQLGDYVGILGGGLLQQPPLYIAAALISQGKSTYVATIMGQQQAIAPQWPSFMKLLRSLKATDLKAQKLEDFLKQSTNQEEEDEGGSDDGADDATEAK